MASSARTAPAAVAGRTSSSSVSSPLVVFPFGEPDMRLEDFLDDKLQSTADLDTLDDLLANVNVQHAQLQSQLDDAAHALDTARGGTDARQAALRAQVDEFNALEQRIAERMKLVNGQQSTSDSTSRGGGSLPEEVVRRLEVPMQQLHRVGLAQQYLALLQDAYALAAAARAQLPADPKAARAPYTQLRRLARTLAARRGDADEAAAHLVGHVAAVADGLWAEMKQTMWDEFAVLLAEREWPAGVDAAVRADETWRDGFEKLLDLQAPEILLQSEGADDDHDNNINGEDAWGEDSTGDLAMSSSMTLQPKTPKSTAPSDALAVLPIDVMADIFRKEFRYHFLSSRKTSDPHQMGDVCFPWFLDRVEKWADFLRDSFADLLAERFEGTDAEAKTVYMDPVCAFVAALLPVMREKVDKTVAYALEQLQQQQQQQQQQQTNQSAHQIPPTPFLSTLIVQLLEFDDELRSRFGYDGGYEAVAGSPSGSSVSGPGSGPGSGWPGLAAPVLESHFGRWLQAEKDGALARYRDIMEGSGGADVRSIDYDYYSSAAARTKPTVAAVKIMELLRSVTRQYRRVRRFGYRLRFLMDIQVTILDAYDDRLRESLEAYYSMTSTVGRTLHGVTKEQLAALEGTGGLETLCKVYGSADHVVNTLTEWGDEEFFIILWDELQARSKKAEDPSRLTGGLSYNQAHTTRQRSASSASNKDGRPGHGNGILFDETIQAFNRRRKSAQEFLVSALAESHRKAFRPYVLRVQWTTVEDAGSSSSGGGGGRTADARSVAAIDPSQLAITPELDEPLRVVKRNLEFLRQALGTAVLRRTARAALEKLQDLLWGEVLIVQSFTTLGAAQLARDVGALAAVVEQQVPRSSSALEGLREGVQLLNLPVVAPPPPPAEEENRGDNTTMTTEGRRGAAATTTQTLEEVSDRMFTDNTEAKKALQELGLTTLSPANARLILQRRVENTT